MHVRTAHMASTVAIYNNTYVCYFGKYTNSSTVFFFEGKKSLSRRFLYIYTYPMDGGY